MQWKSVPRLIVDLHLMQNMNIEIIELYYVY